MSKRAWIVGVGTIAVTALILVIATVLHGALIGATLASGEDWNLKARWSPFGSSVTYPSQRGRAAWAA